MDRWKTRLSAVAIAVALTIGPGAIASAQAVSAGGAADVGSAQRRAILDALRPHVARDIQGPVEFLVEKIEVQAGWALVWAQPQRPGGGLIDPRTVLPPEQLEFSDGIRVDALLRFDGGRWEVEGYQIGATDVWYHCYEGAPPALTGCSQ